MADDGISDLGAHNLGRWQEPWRCVDGGLRVIKLKLGWLHKNSVFERQPMSLSPSACKEEEDFHSEPRMQNVV